MKIQANKLSASRFLLFNRYVLHDNGDIYSLRSSHQKIRKHKYKLKPITGGDGYHYVVLSNMQLKRALFKIHTLVAHCFISARPNQKQINHIDGNKQNNSFKNLEYVTHIENYRHAVEHHLVNPYNNRVISVSTVRKIRKRACKNIDAYGKPYFAGIARITEIHRDTVRRIVCRTTYNTGEYND